MKRLPLKLSASLVAILIATTLSEGTINVSIAQTQEKTYQIQNEKVTKVSSMVVKNAEKEESFWYIEELPMNYEEQKFLYKLCERFEMPYNLLLAQIRCESNFNNTVIGSSGDTGYMQILPSWDKYLEQELNRKVNLKDSFDNLESGTLLLYYNILSAKEYDGKEKYIRALNAYNQGGQNSLSYAKRNGYNAWHYGKRIYKTFQEYEKGNYSYDPYK